MVHLVDVQDCGGTTKEPVIKSRVQGQHGFSTIYRKSGNQFLCFEMKTRLLLLSVTHMVSLKKLSYELLVLTRG